MYGTTFISVTYYSVTSVISVIFVSDARSQALYIQHLQASLLLQKSTILHQLKHQSFQLLHLSDIDILSQSLTHYSVLGSDFLIFILSSFSAFVPYSFVSSFLFPGKTQAITKEKIVATMYPI